MPFNLTANLGIECPQAAVLLRNSRGFGMTANGHFIFVISPGFQVFVSAGSVSP
jgi:hypothetical protein